MIMKLFPSSFSYSSCAVDVYPEEPLGNGPGFVTQLQNCPNTILTPHIGGSTEEAQTSIGIEVAQSICKYLNTGSTIGCVNLPELELKSAFKVSATNMDAKGNHLVRVVNFHRNVPGVLKVYLVFMKANQQNLV